MYLFLNFLKNSFRIRGHLLALVYIDNCIFRSGCFILFLFHFAYASNFYALIVASNYITLFLIINKIHKKYYFDQENEHSIYSNEYFCTWQRYESKLFIYNFFYNVVIFTYVVFVFIVYFINIICKVCFIFSGAFNM